MSAATFQADEASATLSGNSCNGNFWNLPQRDRRSVSTRSGGFLMSGDDLFTRGEVALRLRTSERTVARLAAAGDLEQVWIAPRTPRIVGESVEAYLRRIRGQLAEPTSVA